MFFNIGRLPVTGIVATALFLATSAHAQHHTPLTMAEAEDLALENEPGQVALMARAEALNERSVAAGQLPQPQLRVELLLEFFLDTHLVSFLPFTVTFKV